MSRLLDELKQRPDAALMTSARGWLPLHSAAAGKASAEIVAALLKAHPVAARTVNVTESVRAQLLLSIPVTRN